MLFVVSAAKIVVLFSKSKFFVKKFGLTKNSQCHGSFVTIAYSVFKRCPKKGLQKYGFLVINNVLYLI